MKYIASLLRVAAMIVWPITCIGQGQESRQSQTLEWSDSVSVGAVFQDWKFEIKLYKHEMVWCEPIYLRKTITNLGGTPRRPPIIDFAFSDLGFVILNSTGKRMPLLRPELYVHGEIDTTLMLVPGDSIYFELDLLSYGPRLGPSVGLAAYPPDEYTVDISLYLDPAHRAVRSENTMTLPQLKFNIVEPTGDSAEALRLLAKAKNLQHQQPLITEACYDSVLTIYSHTPYDELANIELIYYRFMGPRHDIEEYIRWSERYFLKYINSPFGLVNVNRLIQKITPDRMKVLVRMIQNKPEATKMLRHLKEQNPWIFEESDK